MATGDVGVEWTDSSGKHSYGAAGPRDAMLIVSEGEVDHPDVVRRRPAIELSEEVRGKLENQGIPRHQQLDDLSIVMARSKLDGRETIYSVEMSKPGGEKLTREGVFKQIAVLMNNYDDRRGGVALHYIGDGRRYTGDWCFQDGFITFADLAQLYMKSLRGRVLTIVSDCSHSGSWFRECMTFLDRQGVGPCGHKAREKGILLKVFTSCLAHQIPKQLAYSVYGHANDKNTGLMSISKVYPTIKLDAKVTDAQHVGGRDFTTVICGQKSITDECLCLPHANWHTWSARNRIYTVRGCDGGRKAWHIVLVVDDDNTNLVFVETTQGENAGKLTANLQDYGTVLKSGWGEEPTDEELKAAMQNYQVYQDKTTDRAQQ